MNILQAIRNQELFRPFLSDRNDKLDTWKNWFTALKVLYGLGVDKSEHELIKKCTGRKPRYLPDGGFRTALFLCGRRSGKSRITSVIGAYEALMTGGEKKLAKGELGMVPVISPTQKQSRVVKSYLRSIFDVPMLSAELTREDKHGFELENSLVIEILTADWRTVRSYSMLAVVVDEVCFMGQDEESKVRSDTELIRALDPARATTGGKLIAISSPYAEKGWAYQTWKRNWGNNHGKVLVWRAPSMVMNPTLPQYVVDEAMLEDEASARAEYLAEWRTDVASWLTREQIEALVIAGRESLSHREEMRYHAFVDVSGGRVDDSAIAIAHMEGSKIVLDIAHRWKAPHSPYEVITQMKEKFLMPFGLRRITGDNYAADFVKNHFEGLGIRYIKSEKHKSALYLELLPKMTSGEVELLDDEVLVTQLAGLERRTRIGGRDSVDHVPGAKDDLANAVAGAITCASVRRIHVGAL